MKNLFNQVLFNKTKASKTAEIIQPVQIGTTDLQNELVFFIKPELLRVDDDSKIVNSLKMIGDKMAAYQVEINGIVMVPGKVLADYQIMNRHYGFINQLSQKASEMVSDDVRKEMFKILEKEGL